MSQRLSPGDTAPEFTLLDDTGAEVALGDFLGRKVIVYFYPAAMTPGCTKQACDFTDSLSSLQAAGYEVLGISPDKPEKLAKFRERDGLTITLLSDPDKTVLEAYGAFGEKKLYGKTVVGRDPLDRRRRRGRQGLPRAVQREGHRPRRQAPQGPRAQPRLMSTYLSAARAFAAQVQALPADLSGPGLGEWDLRALVGHTSRSLVTVITYLQQPVDAVAVDSPAAYFALLGSSGVTAGADVTARGVAAGEAMGADPAAYVDALLDRVTGDLTAVDGDPVITTAAGGMRLSDYLPTRTFELVVHGLDIATATAVDWAPPPDALAETVAVTAEVAVLTGSGADLLRLATGRSTEAISIV